MTIETGALEQAYAKVETTFAASAATGGEALAGSDGIRHLELSLESKKNREDSPEKRGTPDVQQRLPRRQTSNFNLSSIMWEPSGTLGTSSNAGKFLRAGMGNQHTANLDTTVEASPAATDSSATLTSVTGLAVGDVIVFTVGGVREATVVLTIAGDDITFLPLSAAPDDPGQATSGLTHLLASNLTQSLAIYKYYNAGGFKQATFGNVVDQIQANFDGTREVLLALQGPAARYADNSDTPGSGTVQNKPGTHVTVGSPASGLVGNFMVDDTAFLVIASQITIANAIELRNKELGTAWASGIAGRTALRKVTVSVTFYLEDMELLGRANTITEGALRMIVGDTNGSMVAAILPRVEFEIPSVGNEIGPKELTIEGTALATVGNDQVYLAEI